MTRNRTGVAVTPSNADALSCALPMLHSRCRKAPCPPLVLPHPQPPVLRTWRSCSSRSRCLDSISRRCSVLPAHRGKEDRHCEHAATKADTYCESCALYVFLFNKMSRARINAAAHLLPCCAAWPQTGTPRQSCPCGCRAGKRKCAGQAGRWGRAEHRKQLLSPNDAQPDTLHARPETINITPPTRALQAHLWQVATRSAQRMRPGSYLRPIWQSARALHSGRVARTAQSLGPLLHRSAHT